MINPPTIPLISHPSSASLLSLVLRLIPSGNGTYTMCFVVEVKGHQQNRSLGMRLEQTALPAVVVSPFPVSRADLSQLGKEPHSHWTQI